MGKKQQALGKSFEQNLCWWFSSQGYYVIYNERNASRSAASRCNNNQKQYCYYGRNQKFG